MTDGQDGATGAETVDGHFDVERLRRDFPILALEPEGNPLVYLDNAASAQKPRCVVERMVDAFYNEYSNVHRGGHYLASAATEGYEKARRSVGEFLNASSPDEIVFTKSATEAINLVAQSFGEAFIRPGDEIVLSIAEHHANVIPWHFLRQARGAVLKWVDTDERGALSPEAFERALSEKTKIVAVTHMSNVSGIETPLKEIVWAAHARGIPVLADGSQGAVHLDIDVQDLDVDFYAITGHKLYGPTGIGALYGKAAWLGRLPPFLGGGEMVGQVGCDTITYADPPYRFEAGTPPIVEAIGLGAALDYVRRVGREGIAKHEHALGKYAREMVSQMPGFRLVAPVSELSAIISFVGESAHALDISAILGQQGVAVRAGMHCAQPLHKRLGLSATCRASLAFYNTFEEIDRFADALLVANDLLG